MTSETCLRLAENCRKHGDEEGALMYESRAARKRARNANYYEAQAKAHELRGDAESAAKWRALATSKNLEKANGKK
jgi:hypothetical protein